MIPVLFILLPNILGFASSILTNGTYTATVKQYICGQLAALRLPHGTATRPFVVPAELERYRRASLGSQGWDDRRRHAPPVPAGEPGVR